MRRRAGGLLGRPGRPSVVVLRVDRVGVAPSVPADMLPLVRRLHDRCARVLRDVNPDAIKEALRRELRVFRKVLSLEHGHFVERAHVVVQDESGAEDRVSVP